MESKILRYLQGAEHFLQSRLEGGRCVCQRS